MRGQTDREECGRKPLEGDTVVPDEIRDVALDVTLHRLSESWPSDWNGTRAP
jgi:hypothetical protein